VHISFLSLHLLSGRGGVAELHDPRERGEKREEGTAVSSSSAPFVLPQRGRTELVRRRGRSWKKKGKRRKKEWALSASCLPLPFSFVPGGEISIDTYEGKGKEREKKGGEEGEDEGVRRLVKLDLPLS